MDIFDDRQPRQVPVSSILYGNCFMDETDEDSQVYMAINDSHTPTANGHTLAVDLDDGSVMLFKGTVKVIPVKVKATIE